MKLHSSLPEIRRNFLTMADACRLLSTKPTWAERYKGDLQMHTVWSDGSASVMEMAQGGIERGYEYIGITDHSKGLKIAGGIDEATLRKQAAEIEQVNQELASLGHKFRVLRSTEMNLNPRGEGDMELVSRIFKNSGAYSEKQVQEIVFHLTDWIDDLKPFADFLDDPNKCKDDEAMRIIIKFLAHAPGHLKIAAEHVLDPGAKV